jgi:hypothetical protein
MRILDSNGTRKQSKRLDSVVTSTRAAVCHLFLNHDGPVIATVHEPFHGWLGNFSAGNWCLVLYLHAG